MTSAAETPRGRRKSSSRAAIEEAACELFLENTYARTTIDDIANRAGVSRASFFNYFGSKSDLLWGEADAVIAALADRLAGQHEESAIDDVARALVEATTDLGPERIPLAATQWELMGARDDLLSSGIARFDALAGAVRRHVAGRCRATDPLIVASASFAIAGAVTAAAASWASAGVGRGNLADAVRNAVQPVRDGFRPVLH